jgi:hypothetical protein
MKKIIYAIIVLAFGSCMSVSKQQRKIVQQFATKTENFSVIPEKMMKELADIREARGIYYANSFTDPALHLDELNAIVEERMKDDKIPGQVGTALKILDEYAGALVELSSDSPAKSSSENYVKFGAELESLIGIYNQTEGATRLPDGIGTAIAQAMNTGTKYYLAHRQYKDLKKFVTRADTLVAAVCTEMIVFLSSKGLGQLIQAEASGVTESFRFYFTKRMPAIEDEKEYITLMKRVNEVKMMQNQTIQATKSLRKVHQKLAAELNRKFTYAEIALELNNFCREVESLNASVKAIGNQ